MRNTIAFLALAVSTVALAAPPHPTTFGGVVHGGQQPIVGSAVYLYEPGITGATSKSILISAAGTTMDSSGNYYVTTSSTGTFSISSTQYTCDLNRPVYAYSVGGNPGGGTNSAIGLLLYLGVCSVGNSFTTSTTLVVNEISTIAMAYAVAGFAVDPTHIGTDGSAPAVLGIKNAFNTAGNLITTSSGTPAANFGNASVPVTTINTLADIIATCVNTNGPTSPGCSALFSTATSTGTSAGSIPTNTASAAINIAHHPGANVSTLYRYVPPQVPFNPTLSSAPNDWTVQLTFTGNGIGDPWSIAIDGSGNAWIASAAANTTANPTLYPYPSGSIAEISATTATVISPSGGYESSYFNNSNYAANAIAIDSMGNVWVATNSSVVQLNSSGVFTSSSPFLQAATSAPGCSTSTDLVGSAYGIAFDKTGNAWITAFDSGVYGAIYELSSSGGNVSGCGYSYSVLNAPIGVAVDGNGHIWIADYSANAVVELNSDGSQGPQLYSSSSSSSLQAPNALGIDSMNNIWVANSLSTQVTEISSSLGTITQTPSGYGLIDDDGVAIDGSGNAWFTPNTNNDIGAVELPPSGAALSGSGGYATSAATTSPNAHYWSAIDGSGNVWVTNTYADTVSEILGAATPVLTPLAVAVADGKLGVAP